ncbi:ATP-binding protein [Streptomyces sp. J2-1]|uniref:ATP-binding protein n=1 Tax=Streptomyces corallincola TaxID=2851888 RepID=UPI001C390331|nr:ATP-binding protein [Streptomyces corallincola]MBV2357369.1 ATP-binding protein [Streptomyces corallincola]
MPTDPAAVPEALLLTGTVGAGKTSVATRIGELLASAGVPNAVIDLDALCDSWPPPVDDPFNTRVMLANLRSVVLNYRAAGVNRFVLAGVVENAEERDRCAAALGAELLVCRLRVDLDTNHARLRARHANEPHRLPWYLKRSGELADLLDRARVEDFTLDTTDRPVGELATSVLERARTL